MRKPGTLGRINGTCKSPNCFGARTYRGGSSLIMAWFEVSRIVTAGPSAGTRPWHQLKCTHPSSLSQEQI